jgi:hypothetical protein
MNYVRAFHLTASFPTISLPVPLRFLVRPQLLTRVSSSPMG